MTTVAFLGLGNMGGPMAANLVAAGHTVRGFDPVPAAQESARGHGVDVVESPRDAVVDAEVVITMLPNGTLVRQVYDELLPLATPGTLFVDSSTVSVEDARVLSEMAHAAGMRALDTPVSGGVKGAAAGTLTFMVGGSDDDRKAVQPLLEVMGTRIVPCGGPGAGQAAKLCNNMILGVQQIVVAEAFVLAEGLGLSPQALYDVVTGATGNCWAIQTNCPAPGVVEAAPSSNDYRPGFASALMLKDLSLAVHALDECGVAGEMGRRAAATYASFVEEGHGDQDFSAVISAVRQASRSAGATD